MNEFLTRLLNVLESFGRSASDGLDLVGAIDPAFRALVVGVAVLLQNFVVTGLFVPANTMVFITASAVSTPTEGVVLTIAIAVGGLLGAIASYGLGYWVGRSRRFNSWLGRHSRSQTAAAHRFFVKRGGPAIFGARFVPVLRVLVPFFAGLDRFPFKRFLAWSAAASVVWPGVYVPTISLLSAPLRQKSGSLLMNVALSLLGFAVLGVAYGVQYVRERVRRRSEKRIAAQSSDAAQKMVQ